MNRQQRRQAARGARKKGSAASIVAAPLELQSLFQNAVNLYQSGDLGGAESALQSIEAEVSGLAEVCHLYGLILLHTDRPLDAVPLLEQAIKAAPRDPAIYNVLGGALRAIGDFERAVDVYKKALRYDGKFTDGHFNLANTYRDLGRLDEAAAHYGKAVALEPDFVDAHFNLGLTLNALERFEDAEAAYRKVLSQAPDDADTMVGLGKALTMQLRYDEAETQLRAAVEADPQSMEAHNNLARALQGQGRTADAQRSIETALALAPDRGELSINYGNILEDQGKVDEAIAAYRDAIARLPDSAEAHTNLGLLLLLDRQYEEGWREYDWRWRRDGRTPRPFPQARWQGEELAGRTVLAWADEGAGDEILFASMLSELSDSAGKCIVECDPRLLGLFGRAFPDIEIHPRQPKPLRGLTGGDIDYQTSFSEMARWLKPNLAVAQTPAAAYLAADPVTTDACRSRYRARGDGLIVGIAWASGNRHRPERNAPLALWDPVLTTSGLQFVSLQYGDHAAEIAETQDRTGIEIFTDSEIDQFASLEDFAAQVAAMDIVVSITNTTVHMAGALGKPVWTMLPFTPDWRYQRERDDTPWYPAMHLFRQSEPRRWDDVLGRVADALAGFRDSAQ